MGKAAKFKKIRRIASQLPVINTKSVIGSVVDGSELIKSGIKEVEGKKVDPELNYRKKQSVSIPLNHNKKMKKLYNMGGVAGVNMYIKAVQQYQQKKAKGK